jgi:hypothetical protein
MRIRTVAIFNENPKARTIGNLMKFPKKYPTANTTLESRNHEAKIIN